jgi:hypothetical protein
MGGVGDVVNSKKYKQLCLFNENSFEILLKKLLCIHPHTAEKHSELFRVGDSPRKIFVFPR